MWQIHTFWEFYDRLDQRVSSGHIVRWANVTCHLVLNAPVCDRRPLGLAMWLIICDLYKLQKFLSVRMSAFSYISLCFHTVWCIQLRHFSQWPLMERENLLEIKPHRRHIGWHDYHVRERLLYATAQARVFLWRRYINRHDRKCRTENDRLNSGVVKTTRPCEKLLFRI